MRGLRQRCFLQKYGYLLGALVLVQSNVFGASRTAVRSTLPDWKANDALVQQLAQPVGVYQFSFQPPQGYTYAQNALQVPGRVLRFMVWAGAPRADKTAPNVMLIAGTLTRSEAGKLTPERALNLAMDGFRKQLQVLSPTWTHTRTQRGRINGLTFARMFWNFPVAQLNNRLHGFMYATVQGTHFMVFASVDREPEWETTVNLAEASTLTFRKQK